MSSANNFKQAAKNSLQKQTNRNDVQQKNELAMTFSDYCNKYSNYIMAALPGTMGGKKAVDRLINIALMAVNRNPKLKDCALTTLFGSLVQAAQLGLEVNSPLGQAYLVPFKNHRTGNMECQFMPGYQGLVELARRTGVILDIVGMEVRHGDVFHYEYGRNHDLKHTPADNREIKDNNITHFYAYAHTKEGGFSFTVMTKFEVDQVRARSKAADSGPWVTDYCSMGIKTVIKRLCKLLPKSVEIQEAIKADALLDDGKALKLEAIDLSTGRFSNTEDDTPEDTKQIEQKNPDNTPTSAPTTAPATYTEQAHEDTAFDDMKKRFLDAGKPKEYLDVIAAFLTERNKELVDLDDAESKYIIDFLAKRLAVITQPKTGGPNG